MLFRKDKTCSSSQEELVNFLIETRQKQELILNFQLKEIEKQIENLNKKRNIILIQTCRIEKIIFWLKECRFLYYLRSGK